MPASSAIYAGSVPSNSSSSSPASSPASASASVPASKCNTFHACLPPSKGSSTEKSRLSEARTAMYVADPVNSQVLHRHSSAKQSVRAHTKAMKGYLDDMDALMNGLED